MAKNASKTNAFGFSPESLGAAPTEPNVEVKHSQVEPEKKEAPEIESASSVKDSIDSPGVKPEKKKYAKERLETKSFYLKPGTHKKIKIAAALEGIGLSDLVQLAVDAYIAKYNL